MGQIGWDERTFLEESVDIPLLARVSEDDDEIRGEALIGLARRRHPDALVFVQQELNRLFAGGWPVEAAELLADASLHPTLQALQKSLSPEDQTHFDRDFAAALAACNERRAL